MINQSNVDNSPFTCPICDAPSRVHPSTTTHHGSHNRRDYTLHECTACDLQFWTPLQADPSVYSGEGFDAYVDYHAGKRPFPRWAEPLFSALPPSPGRALDIGCGDGAVLDRLLAAGFEPNGLDLDEKSVAIARKKFGLTHVSATTLDAYHELASKLGKRFDLVTFFEVLEHQDAPREFLAQVYRLCEPGATVAGSVPNRQRFLARLDRKLSDGDLPPHHFLWFSSAALARLLQRAGFVDITISRTGALRYNQVVSKLARIVNQKIRATPAPLRWIAAPCTAISPLLALIPWIGMRIAPSHLFFRCRIPPHDDSR